MYTYEPVAISAVQLVQSVFCDVSSLVQPPEDILSYPEEYRADYTVEQGLTVQTSTHYCKVCSANATPYQLVHYSWTDTQFTYTVQVRQRQQTQSHRS